MSRGKQAGSIYKRADGIWIATVEDGRSKSGARKRRTVSSTSKRDLLAKLEKLRDRLNDGIEAPELLTIGQVIDEWLDGLQASGSVKPTTIENYRNVAARYIVPFVGRKRLSEFRVGDVERMLIDLQRLPQKPQTGRGDTARLAPVERIAEILDELKRPKLPLIASVDEAIERLERAGYEVTSPTGGRGSSPDALKRTDIRRALQHRQLQTKTGVSGNTRRLARTVLRMALLDAQRKEYVNRNVAALARGPKVDDAYEGRTLTEDQARQLVAAAADDPLEAFIVVGLSLGLRPGETLALRWDDIDLEAGVLSVSGTLARTRDGLLRQSPKTSKSRRALPMPKQTADALKRQRKRQAEYRLRAGRAWSDTGYVLTNEIGEPLDPATARHAFQKITLKLFGEKWRPHEMRHSAASLLLAQGVPLRTISDVLGHSSIQITSDTYAHMATIAHADVLNRLSSTIGAPESSSGRGRT